MEREIKFRGLTTDNNKFIFGYLMSKDIIGDFMTNDYVKLETIGQFTGLKDKNGVDIYEGDIIEYYGGKRIVEFTYGDGLKLGIIYNERQKGIRQTHENWTYNIASSSIIIGNIHENLELLNQN